MGLWEYWGALLRMALRHSADHAQATIFTMLIVTGALGWMFPFPAALIQWLGLDFDVSGWRFAAIAIGAIIVIRLFQAPFWMHQEATQQIPLKVLSLRFDETCMIVSPGVV